MLGGNLGLPQINKRPGSLAKWTDLDKIPGRCDAGQGSQMQPLIQTIGQWASCQSAEIRCLGFRMRLKDRDSRDYSAGAGKILSVETITDSLWLIYQMHTVT